MTRSAPPDRRYADDHLPELTERQRRVLDLIVAGKTNAQIGEALEITLDGAKWNVSEILTRLGFSSREEAAEYWRSRGRIRRQLARPLRALLGLPLALKAAGAVGAVAVAGLGAWWAFAGSGAPERASTGTPPFYLEAAIEVVTDPAIGTSIAGSAPSGRTETSRSTLRWWYRDQDEWRWEVETTEPPIQAGVIASVADGSALWSYSSLMNTYTREAIPKLPEGAVMGPSFAAYIGPLPAKTVDQFLEMVRSTGKPPMHAEIVGEERVLGRRTQIIEMGPTSTSSSGGGETYSGSSRVWVDPERMFALRTTSDSGDSQTYRIEVAQLRYNELVARDHVRFVIPAGARLATDTLNRSSGSGVGIGLPAGSGVPTLPAGFLAPSYVPAGYSARGTMVASGTGPEHLSGIEVDFSRDDRAPGFIALQERMRAGGLPESARTGQRIALNGREAYRSEANGVTSITWADSDLVIVLSADALAFDELLRMAESIGGR